MWALALAGALGAGAVGEAWASPPVVAFQQAHPLVLGMDAAYSLPLGSGRSLWLFGDTLLGRMRGGQRVVEGMPPCTAAWGEDRAVVGQGGAGLRFFGGKLPAQALVVGGRPAGRRHWPMAPFVAGGKAHLAFVEIEAVGTGPYDFRVEGTGLAEAPLGPGGLPRLPYRAGALRWGPEAPSFGAGVLQEGGWTYLYAGGAQTHLARVPSAQVGSPGAWRYWTGRGWGPGLAGAASVAASGPEVGVRRAPGGRPGYWMCHVAPLGRTVLGRWAPRPEGPWGEARVLGPAVAAGDGEAIAYGAKWHPQLDSARGVALSWNTNAPSEALPRRVDLYWPRLAWVPFGALGPEGAPQPRTLAPPQVRAWAGARAAAWLPAI